MAKVPLDESAEAVGTTGAPSRETGRDAGDATELSASAAEDVSDWDDGYDDDWIDERLRHPIASWEASSGRRWLPGISYPIAVWAVWRVAHAALVLYLADPSHRWASLVNSAFFYDGERYDTIMRHGYELPNASMPNTAFFPGVSWLGWPIYQLTRNTFWTGHIVATVTALAAFIAVWGVSRAWTGEKIARRSVWLLALMPSSLFLWAFYSEGLFIALGAGAVWADRRNKHWLAAVLFLALSTTRSVAILIPAVVILARIIRHRRIDWWCVLYGAAAVIGMIPVLWMMKWYTGDPLAFMKVQNDWGRAISPPWTTVVNGFKNLWPEPETIMVPALVSRNLDLWCLPIVLVGIVYAAFAREPRRPAPAAAPVGGAAVPAADAEAGDAAPAARRHVLPMEAWMIGVALIALPLCSTSLASFNRFVMADWVIYPAFAVLASRLPPWWRRAFWTVVIVALAVTTYHMVGRFSVDRFVG